jgi:ATP-binding cassette subfamily C exporter for protease/lipase
VSINQGFRLSALANAKLNGKALMGNPSVLKSALWAQTDLFRQALWFSLAINLLMLAPTVFMMQVYDMVLNSQSIKTLMMLLLLVFVVYVFVEILEWVRLQMMTAISLKFDATLRNRVFDAMYEARRLQLPGGSPQALSDLRVVRDFMGSPMVMAFLDAPASLVFLLLVLLIHPSMALFALIGAICQFLLAVRAHRITEPQVVQSGRAGMEAQAYVSSALNNAEVVEAMGMFGAIHDKWMVKQKNFLLQNAASAESSGLSAAVSKFGQAAQGSLMMGLGCWLTIMGLLQDSGALMIVASILGGRMLAPLVQIIAQWKMVVSAKDSYARLDVLLESVPLKHEGMQLPPPVGQLVVENLFVAAPGKGPSILKGLSFVLNAGESLALIGPSASGKTTLTRALMGIWPAQSGKVRLDGADVFQWSKENLGPYLGYLPQTVELFDGTLSENIARFGDVEMDKVQTAARLLGLDDFVQTLPEKYHTRVGAAGAFLSGGQRQRLALARAVYGMPKLIVLDEPNSSLDEQGDALFIELLNALKAAGSTVVIVTHKSSPLAVVDKILFMNDGRMQLWGPRDEVLAKLREVVPA